MTTTTSEDCTHYIPVSVATISVSSVTNFPFYIREDRDSPVLLYRDADYPFEKDDVQRLIDRGVKNLYVALHDHDRYQQYLRNNFATIVNDESLPVQQRFGCLNEVVRDLLAHVFARKDTAKTVAVASSLAAQTVELICREEEVAAELLQVLHHDYHTFTHSANVSYYCVMLAKAWGITDRDELRRIATGALLHDIGKLDIDEKILKKPGRLNKEEWQVIQQHPTTGLRLLSSHNDLDFAQLMMVYQHHERIDGTGYPVGISKDKIHPWAQLCAIVDIYEALTSHRPYRPALSKSETIEILERQKECRLNEGMWECWKTIIQNS